MFKKLFITTTILVGLIFCGVASASCTDATQSCTGNLNRVLINDAGDLFLSFNGADVRDTGCTAATNFMVVRSDNPQFTNYYAMSLTAFAGGLTIFVRSQNASPTCEVRNMFLTG